MLPWRAIQKIIINQPHPVNHNYLHLLYYYSSSTSSYNKWLKTMHTSHVWYRFRFPLPHPHAHQTTLQLNYPIYPIFIDLLFYGYKIPILYLNRRVFHSILLSLHFRVRTIMITHSTGVHPSPFINDADFIRLIRNEAKEILLFFYWPPTLHKPSSISPLTFELDLDTKKSPLLCQPRITINSSIRSS